MNIRLAAVIIFLTGSLTLARAEDTVAVMQQAQGSLDYTLNSLRASVVRLTEENRNLTAANRDVAAKIPLLNEQLKALQADEAKTRAQFQALEEILVWNPKIRYFIP